jgi:gluconokinase
MSSGPVRLVVLMGVTGCGKSTVGRALAASLRWDFLEGDAFHTPMALSKMVRGEGLVDADRIPWLHRLADEIQVRVSTGRPSVLACSALKESYRTILRAACPDLLFVHLAGDAERLSERLSRRTGHFADERLLPSQFAALEPCDEALKLDAFRPVEALVAAVEERLALSPAAPAAASERSPAG